MQTFRLKNYGPNVNVPRATLIKDLLAHAPQFISDWRQLARRARQHEIGGGDLILVELTVL